MYTITKKEYTEITGVITKNCCRYCSSYVCSESDCDIHKIYELLNGHLEDNDIQYDEELPFS